MKKFVSVIATFLLTFTGLTVASQPAMAWTTPSVWDTSATVDLEVGVWTTLDWGCGESGITNVSWDTGTLPDGLTIDSSGYVSGTPTTVGDSTLWGYKCTHGGSTGHIYGAHVTLHVHLPYSPTPTIALADLGDPSCTAEFTVVLPMTPEAGSVSLTVTNGYNTVVVGLTDLTAGTTNIFDHPITNFGAIGEDSRVTSVTPAVNDPFVCGDFISATLTYRAIGRESASSGASSYIAGLINQGPLHGGTLTVSNVNNSSCDAHISGSLDATPDSGQGVYLHVSNQNTTWYWLLRDYGANEPISLDLSLNNIPSFVDGVNVLESNGTDGGGDLNCGDLITVEIAYMSNSEEGLVFDPMGAFITTPPPPAPAAHLTFSNPNDSACDLHISGSFDTDSDPSTSVVINVSNGTAHGAWILRGYSATETLSLDLSLNDISTFVDGTNVISLDSMNGSGGFSCGDTVTGSIVYISGGLPYFDEVNTGVNVTQYSPPPPPPPAVDPTATLSATYLGGSTCQIDVSGSFNVDVDHNSISLIVENDSNAALVINLNDLVADEVYTLHLHLNDPDEILGLSTQTTRDVFAISAGAFKCGDVVSVMAYAEKNTEPFINNQTSPVVTIPQAHLSVTNLNDALCELHIVGTIPVQADLGSIALDFVTETGTASATLGDYLPGTLIDLTFSMNSWNFESTPYIQDYSTSSGWSPECGDPMTTSLSYLVNGVNADSTTIYNVVPTRPITTNAAPLVSVVAIPSEQCSVVVSGIMPVALDDATLLVGDFGPYGGWLSLNLTGTPIGSPFTITIPMSTPLETRSPYIGGEIGMVGAYNCGGRLTAQIDGHLDGSEITGITSNTSQSELYCYPGKYQLDGACAPAQRGYFVDTLNARSQTPCPSGYSTSIVGATSLGDCYKVLVQNIKDLKPPKAMKFKKVIGLPLTTTANVRAQVSATGPCTVSVVLPGAKVAGKKVKVPTLAVTSTSVAGNCVLTFTSGESGQYGAFSKVVTIKVNRRGK